jgi:hypothetical protein
MYVLQKHTLSILNTSSTITHSSITYSYTVLEYTYHYYYITLFPHTMPRYSSTWQPSCFTSARPTTYVVHACPIINYHWNTIMIRHNSNFSNQTMGGGKKRARKYQHHVCGDAALTIIDTVRLLHILRIVP